jgi:hypothetical protein
MTIESGRSQADISFFFDLMARRFLEDAGRWMMTT